MDGDQTTIQNAGGETHTFTRVQRFGGVVRSREKRGHPVTNELIEFN